MSPIKPKSNISKIDEVLELLKGQQEELTNIEKIRKELVSTLTTTIDKRADYLIEKQSKECFLRMGNSNEKTTDLKGNINKRIDDLKEELLRDINQSSNNVLNQLKIIDSKIDVHINEGIKIGKIITTTFLSAIGTALIFGIVGIIDWYFGSNLYSFITSLK